MLHMPVRVGKCHFELKSNDHPDTSGEVPVPELQEIQVAQSQSFLVSGKFYFVEYTFHDSIF